VSIAILSDIHSNLDALDAVLRHAEARGQLDGIWCLGDIVGYGAEPSGVIARLRSYPLTAVAGNHDLVARGSMDTAEFNPIAAEAALWTKDTITDADRDFLAGLPLTTIAAGRFTLVHGSLAHPEWEYLLSGEQALVQFSMQTTPYSIVGHSHLQFAVEEAPDPLFEAMFDGDTVDLTGARLILNPGSAGQPRDHDPRAAYVEYDEAAAVVRFHRVEYDIAAAQRKIVAAGLDPWLAERLATGR
jgi:diadenosine tetraphosphatase ApaH/serine/threonine PP2A family protein phosphatase